MSNLADEFREKRLRVGLTQSQVADAVGMARSTYTRVEAGRIPDLTILRASQIAAVLGLDLSVRVYPGGNPLTDAAHASRLMMLLEHVRDPLSYRLEVPLPAGTGQRPDQRAWDAVLFGLGVRTGVEMEMRVRDGQELQRRLELKRRDDPVEGFVLLVANTRRNRDAVRAPATLFPLLPRLSLTAAAACLRNGQHPPSALVLV